MLRPHRPRPSCADALLDGGAACRTSARRLWANPFAMLYATTVTSPGPDADGAGVHVRELPHPRRLPVGEHEPVQREQPARAAAPARRRRERSRTCSSDESVSSRPQAARAQAGVGPARGPAGGTSAPGRRTTPPTPPRTAGCSTSGTSGHHAPRRRSSAPPTGRTARTGCPALNTNTIPAATASAGDSVSAGSAAEPPRCTNMRDAGAHARRPRRGRSAARRTAPARRAAAAARRSPPTSPARPPRAPGTHTWSVTPAHAITCVTRQSRKIIRLCHIHSRPQFSSTSAWCVSRNSRRQEEPQPARLRPRSARPAGYASRSAASAAAVGYRRSGRLLQALQADQFQVAVHRRVQVARRHRLLFEHQQQRVDRVAPPGTAAGR